ncbi:SURF1 family protein [Alteromonadaceae bacterium BrNp21-10]|nr:SURF1 family protein [Alteromonadaceae bacterium BrNp21-10]
MVNNKFKLPIIATLVTFSAIVIMLGLGQWQLQRADEKSQRLEQIQQRQVQQPLSLIEIVSSEIDLRDFPVAVTGEYLPQPLFFIDNKTFEGRIGYYVVAIAAVDKNHIAVNLGWLPAPRTRAELPKVTLPIGPQLIAGVISLPSLNPMISETATADGSQKVRLQQLDLTYLQQFSGMKLLPMVILANDDGNVAYKRQWRQVVMPPEKHIAYAIQWFGLAIALLIVYVVVLLRINKEQA